MELWASVGEGLLHITLPLNTQKSKLEFHSMVYLLVIVIRGIKSVGSVEDL